MRRALFSYTCGVLRRWYLFSFSIIGNPFDVLKILGLNYDPPQWLFWLLLAVGYFVASFLTYYEVRKKLDENSSENFFLELTEMWGGTACSVVMQICMISEPKVIVDALYLLVENYKIYPCDWSPITVKTQKTSAWEFDYKDKLKSGQQYQGVLIAEVNHKEYKSEEFPFKV